MSDGDRVKISVEEGFVGPSDRPVMGEKRLVRYLPVPLPGVGPLMRPCIWMSPYEVFDDDLHEKVKICIILLNEGPPKPDIIAVRIPTAAIEKFPTGPVNW